MTRWQRFRATWFWMPILRPGWWMVEFGVGTLLLALGVWFLSTRVECFTVPHMECDPRTLMFSTDCLDYDREILLCGVLVGRDGGRDGEEGQR